MGGDDSIRVFVGVDMPPGIRSALRAAQAELRRLGADVTWVDPDRIHLTLAFLGDVPSARADEIRRAMEETAAGRSPIPFTVSGLGGFGNPQAPRVVWAGLHAPPSLQEFQTALAGALERLGFRGEDRSFHPHLTLGRSRSPRGGWELARHIETRRDLALGAGVVEAVRLVRSVLRPDGPVHTTLCAAALGGPGVAGREHL